MSSRAARRAPTRPATVSHSRPKKTGRSSSESRYEDTAVRAAKAASCVFSSFSAERVFDLRGRSFDGLRLLPRSSSEGTDSLLVGSAIYGLVGALEAPELDPEESMSNLGLDSLMALELQHSLEESFGTKLPIDLLMGMPSLNEFVTRLLDILAKPGVFSAPEPTPEIMAEETEPRESFPPIVEA